MADIEKTPAQQDVPTTDSNHGVIENGELVLPNSWKYRQRKLFGHRVPWYASPESQLLLVSFVCFLCPGMFNALNGLGGGGGQTAKVGNDTNVALYSTFAVVGFFAGTITNALGIKRALAFGGLGYCVYVSSYLCYDYTQSLGYSVFSGALLGVCAGILWSAQGAIMMSYPIEADKGRYISWFWVIFNFGAVIGSLVPIGQNVHNTTASAVSTGTYIGFLVLTFLGACMAFTLVNAKDVIRKDGSKVIVMQHPSWKTEIFGLFETLKSDPYIVLLFPMFFASNWFTTYQVNDVNLGYYNTRTRSLNDLLYYASQMIGAIVFGYALDTKYRRTMRAKGAWIALFVITFAIWGGGYAFQKRFTRTETGATDYVKADWSDGGAALGGLFLMMFYGFYDAAWQTSVYWYMGSLTNNSRKLANFAGFYKGIQSAGAAIMWRIDSFNTPYMTEFASCWGLLAGSLVIALPVILTKIRDTVPLAEDLVFSDETEADVTVGKAGYHHEVGYNNETTIS